MAEFTLRRLEQGHARIRNVPIAVTPEGFWCCPSPAAIQKTLKNQNLQDRHRTTSPLHSKASSLQRPSLPPVDKRSVSTSLRSRLISDEQRCPNSGTATPVSSRAPERPQKLNVETQQRKISVGFGQLETSDLKVTLHGKGGPSVRMSVHKNILAEHSSFFADKLSGLSPAPQIEMADCEDVEIFVETVAEMLGFQACIKSSLDYLEAAPWIGEEEDDVVSSVRRLQDDNYGISPILNRVASDLSNQPNDTLSHIMELVLESTEDRGRREMKSLVLKLLKEINLKTNGTIEICTESLYSSCRRCLESLLNLFRQASEPGFSDRSLESKDPVVRQITLEADNLIWLLEILVDRNAADEFTLMWASQNELAELHTKVPTMSRHLVSCITCRLFVGIGNGEMLPLKETRKLLLHVWLQPLIDDYSWLQHGSRSFDRKVVEEGIGRTILTLSLEDQQSILLSWLGCFLKASDNCPNLQRAFEVWWRRTFIRPYVEQHGNSLQSGKA
ncbi:hypothetical protein BHE74_00039254 [Ensete ventricosum]|nr:hypothetical protein BHE74_00039254 [Ensete ventricosum]